MRIVEIRVCNQAGELPYLNNPQILLVALLQKETCNLRHSMGLRHPVQNFLLQMIMALLSFSAMIIGSSAIIIYSAK